MQQHKLLMHKVLPMASVIFISGWTYHIYYNIYLKEAYKAKVLGIKPNYKDVSNKIYENTIESKETIIKKRIQKNGKIKLEPISNIIIDNNNIIINKN